MVNLANTKVRDKVAGITKPRSPEWPKVEKAYRKLNPVCECCGSKTKLNVHHKKPFHLYPALELDTTNLITLCMDPSKECHLKIGHGDDFKDYNPNIMVDVLSIHVDISLFDSIAEEARVSRLDA
jgi:hypothetical protein